jgi:hypothetical protein
MPGYRHHTFNELISGYVEWLQKYELRDHEIYFLTFLFQHLRLPEELVIDTMKKEVERFYSVLLTRIVRKPQSDDACLPLFIAFPDRFVAKRKNSHTFANSRPNESVHFHALIAVPECSRLKTNLVTHLDIKKDLYLGVQGKMRELHAKRVDDLSGIVDYTFKHFKRRTFSSDEILILPKSRSELLAKDVMLPRHATGIIFQGATN